MSLITNNSPVLIPVMFLSLGILTPVLAVKKDWVARVIALLASFTSVVIAAYNVSRVINAGMPIHYRLGNWVPPIGIEYVLDNLNAFVILVVITITWQC